MKTIYLILITLQTSCYECIAISTCASNIHINGNNHLFHVDSFDRFESDLSSFCTKHFLNSAECTKIRVFHWERCFKDFPTQISDGDENSNFETSQTDDNKYSLNSNRRKAIGLVDYSQKFGPVLEIFYDDNKYQLQSFLNETPQMSVDRFCGMLHFQHENRKLIGTAFHELFKQYNELVAAKVTKQGDNANDSVGASTASVMSISSSSSIPASSVSVDNVTSIQEATAADGENNFQPTAKSTKDVNDTTDTNNHSNITSTLRQLWNQLISSTSSTSLKHFQSEFMKIAENNNQYINIWMLVTIVFVIISFILLGA